uniref:Uncharacterized protein n=1 Tax=Gossypium raimondii TaxID=29730 RepID=A0A0D2R371_GOSRA|nr:hypothetical protein B456_007G326400 [Gossypium raimondii]
MFLVFFRFLDAIFPPNKAFFASSCFHEQAKPTLTFFFFFLFSFYFGFLIWGFFRGLLGFWVFQGFGIRGLFGFWVLRRHFFGRFGRAGIGESESLVKVSTGVCGVG